VVGDAGTVGAHLRHAKNLAPRPNQNEYAFKIITVFDALERVLESQLRSGSALWRRGRRFPASSRGRLYFFREGYVEEFSEHQV